MLLDVSRFRVHSRLLTLDGEVLTFDFQVNSPV